MTALAQLLVALAMAGARPVTVEAALGRDSLLLLPARDVAAFLGAPVPVDGWTTLAALRREWPSVSFEFDARAAAVFIYDPLGVLPVSKAARAAADRRTRGLMVPAFRSGPFMALAADDLGRAALDMGYTWRGRAAATFRRTPHGVEWGATVAPWPSLAASYASGQGGRQYATIRAAAGPAWVFAAWADGRASLDALVAFRRLSFFASSRDAYAVTINARPVGLQVGRSGKRTTAKLTYGPVPPSPFAVPQVP